MSFPINRGLLLSKTGVSQDPHKDLSPRRRTPWTPLSSLGTSWTLSSSYRALKNMIANICSHRKQSRTPSNPQTQRYFQRHMRKHWQLWGLHPGTSTSRRSPHFKNHREPEGPSHWDLLHWRCSCQGMMDLFFLSFSTAGCCLYSGI